VGYEKHLRDLRTRATVGELHRKTSRQLIAALCLVAVAVLTRPTAAQQLVDVSEAGESTRGRWIAASALGGFYAGLSVWAYFAWYHNRDSLPAFTVNGDGWFGRETYAGGADKLGHFWSNLMISRTTTDLLMLGGWRPLPASLIASSLSLAFFTFVEIKDGFYYQFSTGDMVGNALGAGLSALMVNVPAVDDWIDLRIDYRPTAEYRHALVNSGDVNFVEDYSGQTYLLALHLKAVPAVADTAWLRWASYVDLVAGFGSRNYKPAPDDPAAPRIQELFAGAAVNMQHVLERLLGSGPRQGSRGKRVAHGIGHRAFEFISPPYSTLRLTDTERVTEPR
jgi:hypothetical protein